MSSIPVTMPRHYVDLQETIILIEKINNVIFLMGNEIVVGLSDLETLVLVSNNCRLYLS